jgi:hypothetical protein
MVDSRGEQRVGLMRCVVACVIREIRRRRKDGLVGKGYRYFRRKVGG